MFAGMGNTSMFLIYTAKRRIPLFWRNLYFAPLQGGSWQAQGQQGEAQGSKYVHAPAYPKIEYQANAPA
jgi:hypothetical protein